MRERGGGGGYISTFHIRGTLYPGLDIRGLSSILQLEFRRIVCAVPSLKRPLQPLDEERSPWKLHVRPR